MKRKTERRYDGEPALDDMLDDPLVQLVMARAGTRRRALEALLAAARLRLAGPARHAGSSSVSQ